LFLTFAISFPLQELIQNADDAGAKNVKFLFDPNNYSDNTLLNPKLASFQVNIFVSVVLLRHCDVTLYEVTIKGDTNDFVTIH
jgi:hypothetical protein